MLNRIGDQLRQFRRRTFPSSTAATTQQHDAVIARLEAIHKRLAAIEEALPLVRGMEQSLKILPQIERGFAAVPAIERKLESLVEIEQKLGVLPELERRLAGLPEIEHGLAEIKKTFSEWEFLVAVGPTETASLLSALKRSKSQLYQDIFVLAELGMKRNGYFVEFGATNGVDLSNTYLLEKEYGWTGILAEPAKCWHGALHQNRQSHIETKCVWSRSNASLEFSETDMPELSTLLSYSSCDFHAETRKKGISYPVETISLSDMLEKYNAPAAIDYLSIDTEGSEFDILSNFDFDRYQIKVITCEHNFSAMRERICDLLTARGYRRRFEELSQWDDWYVKA